MTQYILYNFQFDPDTHKNNVTISKTDRSNTRERYTDKLINYRSSHMILDIKNYARIMHRNIRNFST